jgi:uracil-DNA glycosylase
MRSTGSGSSGFPVAPPFPLDSHAPEFGSKWDALEREIRGCTNCSLHAHRTNAVIYRGSATPRVVFVGEAPGATEDRWGLPFVGRSGKRLDTAILEAGLGPEEFGILNLIKCRPPQNRFDRVAATTCRPYLDRQLELLHPPILVSLGAQALRSLDPGAPRVLLAAGHPRRLNGRFLFPLVHPAAALRSRAMAERWRTDVVALRAWLDRSSVVSSGEPS